MKKRVVKRWVRLYLLSYGGKGSSFSNMPSTVEYWCVVGRCTNRSSKGLKVVTFGNPENVTFVWN